MSSPGRFISDKEPRHPLNSRLGDPQSRYGRFGEEKKTSCSYRASNPGRSSLYRIEKGMKNCLLGISPASEHYKPTFRNSVSVPSSAGGEV